MLLLHASFALSRRGVEQAARALFAGCGSEPQWRCARALCDTVALLVDDYPELANELIAGIVDGPIKAKAERNTIKRKLKPRAFFW